MGLRGKTDRVDAEPIASMFEGFVIRQAGAT